MQMQEELVKDRVAGAVKPSYFMPGPPPFSGPTFISGRNKTIHEIVGIPPEKPISLYSLPDPRPGEKPDYTYATLVKIAIWESPAKKLTLQEIYDAIETRFPWFKDCKNPNSWKTSIRHSLSLLAAFQKVPRDPSEPGKGAFWTVDFTKGEGNKRLRKRNKKLKPDGEQSRIKFNRGAEEEPSWSSNFDDHADAGSSDSDSFIDPGSRELSSPLRSGRSSTPSAPRNAPYPTSLSSFSASSSHFGQYYGASGSSTFGDDPEFDSLSFNAHAMSAFDTSSDLSLPLTVPTLHTPFHSSYPETDIFSGDPVNFSSDFLPGHGI